VQSLAENAGVHYHVVDNNTYHAAPRLPTRTGVAGGDLAVDQDRNLLTVAQAARLLNRSTEQVRRYLRENRLPGQRLGGQWFIERQALQQFQDAVSKKQTFIDRIGPARTLRPLDSIIGMVESGGVDISKGKRAFLRAAAGRNRRD